MSSDQRREDLPTRSAWAAGDGPVLIRRESGLAAATAAERPMVGVATMNVQGTSVPSLPVPSSLDSVIAHDASISSGVGKDLGQIARNPALASVHHPSLLQTVSATTSETSQTKNAFSRTGKLSRWATHVARVRKTHEDMKEAEKRKAAEGQQAANQAMTAQQAIDTNATDAFERQIEEHEEREEAKEEHEDADIEEIKTIKFRTFMVFMAAFALAVFLAIGCVAIFVLYTKLSHARSTKKAYQTMQQKANARQTAH